ncbi:MAG: glycosyltransferase family protein [Magnetovibrionaceae bacterium]
MNETSHPRIAFYVQHLLGVGHVARADVIATALREAGFSVDVILGGPEVPGRYFEGCTTHHLPEARAADASFSVLVDANGQPLEDGWWQRRRELLQAILANLRADLFLVELYPFGRRAFRKELDPVIQDLRAKAVPVACSLRDVLVAKKDPAKRQAMIDKANRLFDLVLIHGDPTLIALEDTLPEAAGLTTKTAYTGYVTGPRPDPLRPDRREKRSGVVVSGGGGAVAAPLMRAAMALRVEGFLSDQPWLFLAGPNLDPSVRAGLESLAAGLGPSVTVEANRSDFRDLLSAASLSISQGGYNTVMDLLAAGPCAVVVPFEDGGESEQRFRAEKLAAKGLLTVAEAPTTDALRPAIKTALEGSGPGAATFNLDGGAITAHLLREHLGLS